MEKDNNLFCGNAVFVPFLSKERSFGVWQRWYEFLAMVAPGLASDLLNVSKEPNRRACFNVLSITVSGMIP